MKRITFSRHALGFLCFSHFVLYPFKISWCHVRIICKKNGLRTCTTPHKPEIRSLTYSFSLPWMTLTWHVLTERLWWFSKVYQVKSSSIYWLIPIWYDRLWCPVHQNIPNHKNNIFHPIFISSVVPSAATLGFLLYIFQGNREQFKF